MLPTYNDTTDLDFEVEFTDDVGDTANVTGTLTIQNDGKCVVMVDSLSVENSGVRPSVESESQKSDILGKGDNLVDGATGIGGAVDHNCRAHVAPRDTTVGIEARSTCRTP